MQADSRSLQRACCRVILILLMVFAADTLLAKGDPQHGLRFDSPGVLDLADRAPQAAGAGSLPVTSLAAAEATKILAAPAWSEDELALRFSDDEYGCTQPSLACSQEHERKLIAAADGQVKRIDKRLVVAVGGTPLVFVDWKMPETKDADGDEETHWYLGRMSGNGYHRVEVQFGQDAPGNFLVNPANGKVAFVHNAADVVLPAPDGARLVTYNSLNPPLSIRVAALDATGPRLELQCEAGMNADQKVLFKGWHDAGSFDLVVRAEGADATQAIPLRIARAAGAWSIATTAPERLAAIAFGCH